MHGGTEGEEKVSILVFLELAPGRTLRGSGRAAIRVSILVFLELAPGRDAQSVPMWEDEFQSLFFWNSRPDDADIALFEAEADCFNPCFSGTRARTRKQHPGPAQEVGFQSLFFWNSRPDGMLSYIYIGPPMLFQSLFFWNSRPDSHRCRRDRRTHHQFQSLFFWNSRRTFHDQTEI